MVSLRSLAVVRFWGYYSLQLFAGFFMLCQPYVKTVVAANVRKKRKKEEE